MKSGNKQLHWIEGNSNTHIIEQLNIINFHVSYGRADIDEPNLTQPNCKFCNRDNEGPNNALIAYRKIQ